MYQTVRYEKKDSIGIATINRPEALNALNSALEELIADGTVSGFLFQGLFLCGSADSGRIAHFHVVVFFTTVTDVPASLTQRQI